MIPSACIGRRTSDALPKMLGQGVTDFECRLCEYFNMLAEENCREKNLEMEGPVILVRRFHELIFEFLLSMLS